MGELNGETPSPRRILHIGKSTCKFEYRKRYRLSPRSCHTAMVSLWRAPSSRVLARHSINGMKLNRRSIFFLRRRAAAVEGRVQARNEKTMSL